MNKVDDIIVKHYLPNTITDNSILNIYTNTSNAFTHGFHKYPAKFIPIIPKWAINKYLVDGDRKSILDPFCGSGTTLVEGLLSGHDVVGIDIDPLSILITKVKTTPLDTSLLDKISIWISTNLESTEGTFLPELQNLNHWFTDETTLKLSTIRTLINEIPLLFGNSSKTLDIQDFMIICFSSIIRRVSNADNQSLKTYVSHTKIKTPAEVFSLFRSQLKNYCEKIKEFQIVTERDYNVELHNVSSNDELSETLRNQKFDLVITSPPYIKSIDYIYNQMAELFWIGDLFGLATPSTQNAKKKIYTGTNQINKSEYKHYSPFLEKLEITELDIKLQEIFSDDDKNGHKHSYVTYKYFMEMERHFSEITKVIKIGAHYIMVVGNSSVSNVEFNTSKYLSEIAERNGFKLANYWGYKIKNRYMNFDRKGRGGKIEIDWVLDLVKI